MNSLTFASCIDESKSFDDCLQCCSDSAVAIQAIKKDQSVAKDIVQGCLEERQASTTNGYKKVYEKYKIDYSVFTLLCDDQLFASTGKFASLPYDQCTATCNKKFKAKR